MNFILYYILELVSKSLLKKYMNSLVDKKNIRIAKQYGVTGVMLPFVRGAKDLLQLKNALEEANAGEIRIFAKIENMDGVRRLEELLPLSDEIVIARGDLGNAMPLWQLPAIQKKLIKPKYDPSNIKDDAAKWDVVPTKIEMNEILSVDLVPQDKLDLTGKGGEK